MDNAENLATLGSNTQDEDKQNKKHNPVCAGYHSAQTNKIKCIRHELEVKTIRTSSLCGTRNGHYNTEETYTSNNQQEKAQKIEDNQRKLQQIPFVNSGTPEG